MTLFSCAVVCLLSPVSRETTWGQAVTIVPAVINDTSKGKLLKVDFQKKGKTKYIHSFESDMLDAECM